MLSFVLISIGAYLTLTGTSILIGIVLVITGITCMEGNL